MNIFGQLNNRAMVVKTLSDLFYASPRARNHDRELLLYSRARALTILRNIIDLNAGGRIHII